MSWFEWQQSKEDIKSLDKYDTSGPHTRYDKNLNLGEVIEDMRVELNTANKKSHKIAFVSYLLAGIVATGSTILAAFC